MRGVDRDLMREAAVSLPAAAQSCRREEKTRVIQARLLLSFHLSSVVVSSGTHGTLLTITGIQTI